jgi:hypothetical protein
LAGICTAQAMLALCERQTRPANVYAWIDLLNMRWTAVVLLMHVYSVLLVVTVENPHCC